MMPGIGEARRYDVTCGGRVLGIHARLLASEASQGSEASRSHGFLLLHGNPGTLEDWSELAPSLARLGDVAAIDLPGFGRSDVWPGVLKDVAHGSDERATDVMAILVDGALGVLDALGWRASERHVHVVGHSHGGGVAQQLAAHHPSRVTSLILLGSLGAPAHPAYRLLMAPWMDAVVSAAAATVSLRKLHVLRAGLVGGLSKLAFWPAESDPRWTARLADFLADPARVRWMTRIAQQDPSQSLRRDSCRLECPCLFLHGDQDQVVPSKYALAIASAMQQAGRHCVVELLEGSGHMLPQRDATTVMRHVEAFLHTLAR